MRAFYLSHRGAIVAAALVALSLAATPAVAQEADYTAAANPFQDEFEYEVGADLRPLVAGRRRALDPVRDSTEKRS